MPRLVVVVAAQADCIELGPEELEALKYMCCLESLSLSGLTKLTDATLGQVGAVGRCRVMSVVGLLLSMLSVLIG